MTKILLQFCTKYKRDCCSVEHLSAWILEPQTLDFGLGSLCQKLGVHGTFYIDMGPIGLNVVGPTLVLTDDWWQQGCQPVRNFRILYGFYMQNTGIRIWPRKYGNWALSVLSLKVLLPEQSLPVLGSKSVRICGILCLRTFKYLFNHQNIQSSLFHM